MMDQSSPNMRRDQFNSKKISVFVDLNMHEEDAQLMEEHAMNVGCGIILETCAREDAKNNLTHRIESK